MAKILKVKNVSDYSSYVGQKDKHPLVSVIDYASLSPVPHSLNDYSVYGLFLHKEMPVGLTYGCGKYDFKACALICVAPGQIGGAEDDGGLIDLDGWALLFHPDILHGTQLEKDIKRYSFFDYRVNEALHMSEDELALLESQMRIMKDELDKPRDEFQDRIIVAHIELILNYAQRFYNRQFVTRKPQNEDTLVKFHELLIKYFAEQRQVQGGIPTVQYCADQLCMSPNYFSDLVRKTSGDTASNHIRRFVVQEAKNRLASGDTVAQVAYGLGFEYPQHFTRMFKKQTGLSPSEYLSNFQKQ